MSSFLQLYCFFFSFLYGILFGIITNLHFKLICHYHLIFKFLISIVFIIDVVLGYILLMYKLNLGIFHIYFLIFVLIGFICSFPLIKWFINKLILHKKCK